MLLSKDQKSTPVEISWQGHVMGVFGHSGCHLPICGSTEHKNKCHLLCASPQIAPKTH